jgi:hypothetical protein
MLLGIVADDALLQVLSGKGKLSQAVQTRPQWKVSLEKKSRVLYTLSQAEELLPQLARRLVLRPH